MARSSSGSGVNPLTYGASWLASLGGLPLSMRAVFGYYSDSGIFDYRAMKVKSYVDDQIAGIINEAFESIEQNLEAEFQISGVEFHYGTKLTLPAELTLGYLYRRILKKSPSNYNPITQSAKTEKMEYFRFPFDKKRERRRQERLTRENQNLVEEVEGIEQITRLVVEALIDGDMRDALNDEEYNDFTVNFDVDTMETSRRIAKIAQETLQVSIENRLREFPRAVSDAYESAVEISEGHQQQDDMFRNLLNRDNAKDAIREEYKFAEFESPPDIFDQEIIGLPYLKTQYDRVGVIYDGMIDMYRGAGYPINDDFKRSIVLAIIGAQIWLDDVSDYFDDLREGQLTPVTAEYKLGSSEAEAYANIIDLAETYFDYAKDFATESGTPMTGIAVEYIYRKGETGHLPR